MENRRWARWSSRVGGPLSGLIVGLLAVSSASCSDVPGPAEGATVADTGQGAQIADAGCQRSEACPAPSSPCMRAHCASDGVCGEVPDDGKLCDDGDPCTVVDVCVSGKCTPGSDWCACRGDGDCVGKMGANACEGAPYCDKASMPWACRTNPVTAVVCKSDKDTICAVNRCDPLKGKCAMTPVNAGASCEDDDPCTVSACSEGTCKAGEDSNCQCESTADCAAFEDGNLCTGTLFCDLQQWPLNVCKVNPATVVKCGTAGSGPCQINACDPEQGKCALMPVTDGTPCDDGDPCTGADACKAGKCAGTDDVCKCSKTADCDKLEDGNLCNGVLYCDLVSATCKLNPKTVVNCPSVADSACSKNLCNPKSGTCAMTAVPPGTTCDDGDKCTVGEVCVGGSCTAGTNACACKSDADCAAQEDGNLCNGTLFCHLQTGLCVAKPNSAVLCKTVSDTTCNKAACNPKDGSCALTPIEMTDVFCVDGGASCRRELKADGAAPNEPTACNDGDACTDSDTCVAGKCVGGADLCSCKSDLDCAAEDDGNPCNGTLYCDKSGGKPTCKINPATVVKCTPALEQPCRKNTCVAKTGKCALLGIEDYTPCDDGNACTKSDYCFGGGCKAGVMTCECQTQADCAANDDGDLCNGVPYCDLKAEGGPKCKDNPVPVLCPKPESPCLANTCDKPTGKCVLAAATAGKVCNDGSSCTQGDACKGGDCVGTTISCDDNDACTQDLCDPVKGCSHTSSKCDDGLPCTVDKCDAKTGNCTFDGAALSGKPCDADGNGCTVADTCQGGKCVPGAAAVCKGEGGVCDHAVCASTSAQTFSCAVVAKPDGASCDDGPGCTAGNTCKAGKCQPGDKERLFARSWSVGGGDARATALVPWGGGHLAMAGHVHSGDAAKPTKAVWWLQTRNDLGEVGWPAAVTLTSPVAHAEVQVAGLVSVGGELQVVGTIASAKGGLDGHLWRVGSNGKVLGQVSYGKPAPSDEVIRGVAGLESGGMVWVGDRSDGGEQQLLVMRLSSAGQPLWSVALGEKGADTGRAVATRADGSIAVVGSTASATSGGETGAVRVLDAKGATVWTSTPAPSTQARLLTLVSAGSDWLVGGWRAKDGGQAGWLIRLSSQGKVQWQRSLASGVVIRNLAATGEARFVASGDSDPAGSNADHWLGGLDGLGNLHWSRGIDGGGNDTNRALLALPGGAGLAVAGARATKTGWQAALLRTDDWGHASCQAAGVCHGKTASSCVDNLACTADTCAAIGGCQHKSEQSLACDPADGCTYVGACDKGACKPTADGRLFHRALGEAVPFPLTDAFVLDDGGLVAIGVTTTASGRVIHVLRFDDRGTLLWHQQENAKTHVSWSGGDVAATNDRVAVLYSVVHDQPSANDKWRQYVILFDGAGKLVSHSDDPIRLSKGTDIRPGSQGGFVTVGGPISGQKGESGVLVTRIDVNGKVKWKGWHSHNANSQGWGLDFAEAVVPMVGGDHLVAGWYDCSSWKCGQLASIVVIHEGAKNGYFWGASDQWDSRFHDIALAGDDGYMAAGVSRPKDGNWSLLVARFSPTGNLYWSKRMEEQFEQVGVGVAHLAGNFVVSGHAASGGIATTTLLGIDSAGSPRWQRNYLLAKGNATTGNGLFPLPDGGLWVAGHAIVNGAAQGMLLRADAWGHVSCAEAGGCSAKTAKSCDDGNACTSDLCHEQKGCQSTAMDGVVCGVNKTCKAGQCTVKP